GRRREPGPERPGAEGAESGNLGPNSRSLRLRLELVDLDHVEVAERLAVGERLDLLGEVGRLGERVVGLRRLVGRELDDDQVGVGLVAVLGDRRPSRGALALGGRLPLLVELLDLVDVRRRDLDDLHEPHGPTPPRPVVPGTARTAMVTPRGWSVN